MVEKLSAAFTQEDLDTAWATFKENQTKPGDTEKLILAKKLEKGENHQVNVALESQLEVSFLERLETDLVQHLRSQLKNDHIVIHKSIKEIIDTKKLYTSSDIFDYMVKQNPNIKELKDRLGLDFDY